MAGMDVPLVNVQHQCLTVKYLLLFTGTSKTLFQNTTIYFLHLLDIGHFQFDQKFQFDIPGILFGKWKFFFR